MPNIAVVLKNEISRLSRKEVRREVQPLRKAAAAYRRELAALKRTIASLERRSRQATKLISLANKAPVTGEKTTRFVAKGLVSLRKRLGLSAAELARLLGVSMQSVYNWEHKKTEPRREQVAAIATLRSIGKREARLRLDEKTSDQRAPRQSRRAGRTTRKGKRASRK